MAKKAAKTAKTRSAKVVFSENLGRTLRARRLDLGISLDEIVKETRIQRHYLKAIESGHYEQLPPTIHSVGFVRRYAKLLGLDSTTAATKYLLERGPIYSGPTRFQRKKLRSTIIGTRLFAAGLIAVTLIAVSAYLIWQVSVLAAPPRLSINAPAENQSVTTSPIIIEGYTTTGAQVLINGQYVYVDDQGRFSTTVTLTEGLNVISIEAVNNRDKTSKIERNVLYQPAANRD